MILDALLQFSANQSLIQNVGTYASTNQIDFGIGTAANPAIPSNANGGGARDMGVGDDPALKFVVQVGTTFVSAGGGTLQVSLQGAPDDGTGAPGAFVTWWQSPLYTIAQLVAGARLFNMDMPRPPQGKPVPRFIQLLYGVATAAITAGTISAYLVLDRDDQMYNASDNSILGGYRPGIAIQN